MPLKIVPEPKSNFVPLMDAVRKGLDPSSAITPADFDPKNVITSNDYFSGTTNFATHFSLGAAEGGLDSVPKKLLITELEQLFDSHDEHDHLVVYFGLKDRTIVHGLRAVRVVSSAISPLLDQGEGRLPTHEIVDDGNGTHKVMALPDNTAWLAYQTAYMQNVHVGRAGEALHLRVDPAHDTHCVTFPWKDEVLSMYTSNKDLINSVHEMRVEMSDYSMYHHDHLLGGRGHQGPNGYRHSVSFHTIHRANAASPWEAVLGEGAQASPYHYRGTNLGHLCPPRCRRTTALGQP